MTVQTPVLVISLKLCDSYVTLSHVNTWMDDRPGIYGAVKFSGWIQPVGASLGILCCQPETRMEQFYLSRKFSWTIDSRHQFTLGRIRTQYLIV